MRNMAQHGENFDWSAGWFKFLYRLALLSAGLAAVATVILILGGKSLTSVNSINFQGAQLITVSNTIATAISSLFASFIFRVCLFVCQFLRDFANGLAAQQIKREHRVNNSQ